jgi:hypothetical protein
MNDIVERLERWLEVEGPPVDLISDISAAVAEIKRLRLIAGAVSGDHNSFREMFRRNSNAL